MTTTLRRGVLRLLTVLPIAMLVLGVSATTASAHPLGNFSVNTYNGMRVEPHAVAVRMVVDYAEIPTVQHFPDVNDAGGVSESAATRYAAAECDRLAQGARLRIDQTPYDLKAQASSLSFLPGAASLHTMRLTCELRTAEFLDTAGTSIEYVDLNSLERLGWREITAVGDGVDLADADVPTASVSDELLSYPTDLLSSPLDHREASVRAVAGSGQVTGEDPAADPPSGAAETGGLTAAYTALVATHDLSVGFGIGAMLLSVALGAAHAFAPGHGKTLMAAYMLGQQRSSVRQVAVIGLTVTLTHTAGVLALGLVLSAVSLTAPDEIYSWLGLASGLMLTGIGLSLMHQARHRSAQPVEEVRESALAAARLSPHDPDHQDHHHHHHHEDHHHDAPVGVSHSHGLGGAHTHAPPSAATSVRSLVAVGFVGGMVPAPSALIVLLGGIALGRAWFGVALVVGYGVGMALALTGTGVALAYSRDHIERWASSRRTEPRWSWAHTVARALPTLTAALVVVVGVGLMLRAAEMLTL